MASRLAFLCLAVIGCTLAQADNACESSRQTAVLVDSIRIDKPGLARVYARDGTEFTAGQALWMKGQLRAADAFCARGDRIGATQTLSAVQSLIRSHTHQQL